jgi:hypothetical protein
MDADKLEELERLLRAGTPGPWIFHDLRAEKEWEGDQSYSISVGLGFVDDAKYYPSAPCFDDAALIVAAINALPELVARVRELEGALAKMADCQALPKIYKYTGTAEVDVENMFDVGHRHANGRKPYDYLKSWLSMLRPFAYATRDDSWGEMEKLLSIVMNNYVQTLVKAEAARAALKGPTT